MKIKIVILTIYFALSGCAFKNHTESNDIKLPPMSARYDWKGADSKNQYFKAERGLVQISQNGVEAVSPVTLPVEIPNPIIISSDVLSDIKDRYNFSKAYIQTSDENLELPVKVTFEENRITFYISGLASVIDSKVSSKIGLNVDIFDGSNKIFSYTFDLRTPPSKVSLKFDSDVDGNNNGEKILQVFRRIEINDKVFSLLKTVEVKNDEDQSIEISLPEQPDANLFQEVVSYSYQDIGCDAGGYRYSTNPWNDILASSVSVLPLDQKSITTLLSSENVKQTQVIVLPPNSAKILGIYSISPKSKDRLNQQSLKSTIESRGVLTDCYKVRDYCDPSEHCHGKAGCIETNFLKYESESLLNVCYDKWARHSGSLNIGDQRQNLFVQFDDGQNFGFYRFNDHDAALDPEVRSIPMFQNKESVYLAPVGSN